MTDKDMYPSDELGLLLAEIGPGHPLAPRLQRILTNIQDRTDITQVFEFPTPEGAGVRILEHPWGEHRWFFEYRFMGKRDQNRRPDSKVVWKCLVDYRNGVLQPVVQISMDITIPHLLGKRFLYGLDLSPGAKTYFNFTYEQSDPDTFRLVEIQKGARTVMDLRPMWAAEGEGLIQQVTLPFPLVVPERIQREYESNDQKTGKIQWLGRFKVPFPYRDQEAGIESVHHIYFSDSIVR